MSPSCTKVNYYHTSTTQNSLFLRTDYTITPSIFTSALITLQVAFNIETISKDIQYTPIHIQISPMFSYFFINTFPITLFLFYQRLLKSELTSKTE